MPRLIRKEFFHYKDNKIFHVHMPPWHCGFLEYFFIKRRLKKYSSYLIYVFNPKILSSNAQKTVEDFHTIKSKVIEEINKLDKEYKFKKIIITGISLGCVNATMIADNCPKIKEIYLFDPGNCLAESMWKGKNTQKIKQSYEEQGISLTQLKRKWKSLAPENNIRNLKDRKIHVFLAKKDDIIPYSTGKKLVDKLKKLKEKFTLKIDPHHGHYYTIIKEMILPNDIC